MAFKPQFLTKLEPSSLFTQPSTIPSVQPQVLPPNFWLYSSNGDDIATVSTNGYFVYFADWLNTLAYNNGQLFQVGDLIYINCSDGTGWLSVTQVQPIIETLAATLGPNSVTTADIQNGAVTSAKLAASAVIAGKIAAGTIVNADISAAAAIAFSKLAALTSGNIIVGSAGTVPTSVAMSGDVAIIASGATTIQNNAVTTAKILNANVTLAKLAAGITPSHIIKFAAQYTTTGGAAAEAIVVAGALAASDRAFVQMVADGTNEVTIVEAVVTNDTLTITFSGDPSNNCIINYQIIRAAA